MGLFKSLLSSAGEGPDIDEEPPDVLRRSAVEAALDRMIAARAVEASPSVRPAPLPAHASTLATMSERRSGQDRRDVKAHRLATPTIAAADLSGAASPQSPSLPPDLAAACRGPTDLSTPRYTPPIDRMRRQRH